MSGGAIGAALRYGLSRALPVNVGGWPWPTFAANLLGGLAMGVLAAWLVAASENAMIYDGFRGLLASLPGKVALFAFSASLVYHFLNGIRHLFWDAGHGFSIPKAYASGYAVLALSVVITAVLWWCGLGGVA